MNIRKLRNLPTITDVYSRILGTIPKGFRKPKSISLPTTYYHLERFSMSETLVSKYKSICGFGAEVDVPITLPHLALFPMHMLLLTDPQFPFPVLGTVHMSNKATVFKKFHNDSQTFSATVGFSEVLLRHDKGVCFMIISKLFNVDTNELVWSGESTFLCKSFPGIVSTNLHGNFESKIKPEHLTKMELYDRWTVPLSTGRDYAIVSGDYNPIHLSRISANMFGFSSSIVHGMWTKAKALGVLGHTASLRDKNDSPSNIVCAYAEFKTPLFLPSTVRLEATRTFSNDIADTFLGEHLTKETGQVILYEVCSESGERLPHIRGYNIYC